MFIRSRGLLSSNITPFKGSIIVSDGNHEYIRNTTLKKKFDGYSKRWRHYSGVLVNYGRLPWQSRGEAMTYGSWFAVPHIGRRKLSSPLFHIITSNHNIQPYNYQEMFPEDESLQYFGEHDFTPEVSTSTFDGLQSCANFSCDVNETYCHPDKPLNIAVCHLTHSDSKNCLMKNFEDLEKKDSHDDAVQFPFHIQMMAFDCRPVAEGEQLMIHGHKYSDIEDVTPRMIPLVIKCRVTSTSSIPEAGVFFVEIDDDFEPGISGAPVLRDGRVVGMLTTVKLASGEGIVSISAHIRKEILGIEEKWRYPSPPPFNLLKQRGLLTAEEEALQQLPQRYDMPTKFPKSLSGDDVRHFIDVKFNNPLPVDFAPPKLLDVGKRHQIVSRDRTNPYGHDSVDGGHNIPSLKLFPGYKPNPLIQDDIDKPAWLLKYGCQENYLIAHGIDPADTSKYQPFKNYIAPHLDKDINKETFNQIPTGMRPYGLLCDKTEVDVPNLILQDDEVERRELLEDSFGQEEYITARQDRIRETITRLTAEETSAIESGDQKLITAAKNKIKDFKQTERDISWARGDKTIQPKGKLTEGQPLIPQTSQDPLYFIEQTTSPEEEEHDDESSKTDSTHLKITEALKHKRSSSQPTDTPVDEMALQSIMSRGRESRSGSNMNNINTNKDNEKDIIWGKSAYSFNESHNNSTAEYEVAAPQQK